MRLLLVIPRAGTVAPVPICKHLVVHPAPYVGVVHMGFFQGRHQIPRAPTAVLEVTA